MTDHLQADLLATHKSITPEEFERRQLHTQIEITKLSLQPSSEMHWGLVEITTLVEMFFNYLEKQVDKKMNQVTKKMETAEKISRKANQKRLLKCLKRPKKRTKSLSK